MEEAACGSVQEMLERNNSRLRGLVGQWVACSKACCAIVYEQRVSVSLHGSTGLGLRNNMISRHLFPKGAGSLAKLSFVRLLLHLCDLTR